MALLKNWYVSNTNKQHFVAQVTPRANLLLLVLLALFISFITWTKLAVLDEVTRGQGSVIPSSQVQIIQNLEGGIVEEILVRNGDVVEKDAVLIKIDDTGFSSSYEEKRNRYLSLQAKIARIEAEVGDAALSFPTEVMAEHMEAVQNETQIYNSRKDGLFASLSILKRKVELESQNIKEQEALLESLKEKLALLDEEIKLTKPLAEKNIVPPIDMLRLNRERNDTKSEIDRATFAINKAENARREANDRIEERVTSFRTETLDELTVVRNEYNSLQSTMRSAKDRVVRTQVRSPVKGTIKQILVNTIGGVVQPGMNLVEIVPFEDSLLIEAKIKPQDIAFLRPDQTAMVKISAYDFSIYGGLKGKLEHISADAITDDNGDSFYQIKVRTEKSYLGRDDSPLPIMPGMVASVDILTGQKSVWDYLMKPILKAKQNALRER